MGMGMIICSNWTGIGDDIEVQYKVRLSFCIELCISYVLQLNLNSFYYKARVGGCIIWLDKKRGARRGPAVFMGKLHPASLM